MSGSNRPLTLHAAAATHVGRREHNEDALLVSVEHGVFAVADGMGGYEGGEVASRLVVEELATFYASCTAGEEPTWPRRIGAEGSPDESRLRAAVGRADRAIAEARQGALWQMGSTVVALTVRGGNAFVAHVGDSRAYRLRGARLEALTRDHSLYAELEATGTADLPSKAAFRYANVITRALGAADARADTRTIPLAAGDVFLLCSDGLLEALDDGAIAAGMSQLDPAISARELVDAAFARGGRDNITVVVVRVVDQASSSSSVSSGASGAA